MGGFFSKLVGKKKPTNDLTVEEALALAKESIGESWTEHEISDEIVSDAIVEEADTLEVEQTVFEPHTQAHASEPLATFPAASEEGTSELSEAEFDALGIDIEQTATRLARLNLADMPAVDLGAEPETGPLDPVDDLDDITREIQADIVAAKRVQAQASEQEPLPETRSEPDPGEDLK